MALQPQILITMFLRRFNFIWAAMLLACTPAAAQNTLSLEEAITEGLANNYGIKLVRNEMRIADNNNTAGNAGMLPTLSGNGTYSNTINDTRQQFFNGETREGDNARSSNLSAGLQLQWTVFDGFSMFVERDRLSTLQDVSNVRLQAEVENLVADIKNAYFSIVRQERLTEVLKEMVLVSARRKFIAEIKSNIGAGSKLASLQAVADFNADTAELIRQRSIVSQFKAELNRLMARDPGTLFLVSGELPASSDLSRDALLESAKSANPGLAAARLTMAISEFNIRAANAMRYPRLTLFGGYNFNQSLSEVGLLQLNRNLGPQYGVTASVPIFNGFNVDREIENARIQNESAQLLYDRALLDINAAIYSSYTEYEAQRSLLALELQNLDAARKTANAAQERYKIGSLSDIEYRQAQLSLRDAEIRLLDAQFNLNRVQTELLRLSGYYSVVK